MSFDFSLFIQALIQLGSSLLHIFVTVFPYFSILLTIYIFLLRFAKVEFSRKVKVITDEIIKINDFCIEFFGKHQEYTILLLQLERNIEIEKAKTEEKLIKLIQEMHIIKLKIDNHLSILDGSSLDYPFGSAINYLLPYQYYEKLYSFLDNKVFVKNTFLLNYFSSIEPEKSIFEKLKFKYMDSITDDSILAREISLDFNIDKYKQEMIETNLHNLTVLPTISTQLYDIVTKGTDLSLFLEKKLRNPFY